MKHNLLSVSKFCTSNNVSIEFLFSSFSVKDIRSGSILITAKVKDGVYAWPAPSSKPILAFACARASISDWYDRLGHPSSKIVRCLVYSKCIPLPSSMSLTSSCNKSIKLSFSQSTLTSNAPLQLILSDVWSALLSSLNDCKYFVIFVDHFTKYIWLYPLQKKSGVSDIFVKFQTLVEKYFTCSITQLYTDNGGEFLALKPHLAKMGITHLTTPPHTPEHNDFVERRHRHIVEMGLTLLRHTTLPISSGLKPFPPMFT